MFRPVVQWCLCNSHYCTYLVRNLSTHSFSKEIKMILKLIPECHPIYVDSSYFFEKQKLEIFSVYWKFWSSASIELIDFYKNYEEYFVFCERIDMMMMMKKWCQQLNILRTLAFILSSILEARALFSRIIHELNF